MALRVFDFACPVGHRHELFVDAEVREQPCPECGAPAVRLIGAPRSKLEGFTGDFPTAGDHWVRMRESKMRAEQRVMREHGEYANGKPIGLPFTRWSKTCSKSAGPNAGQPAGSTQPAP